MLEGSSFILDLSCFTDLCNYKEDPVSYILGSIVDPVFEGWSVFDLFSIFFAVCVCVYTLGIVAEVEFLNLRLIDTTSLLEKSEISIKFEILSAACVSAQKEY